MPLVSSEELVGCKVRQEKENFPAPGHSFVVAFCLALVVPATGFKSILSKR